MSEKQRVPDEINIDKNINERNIPDEKKVSEKEVLGLESETKEKEIFDIANFLVEPKIDYGGLIKATEEESKLGNWDKKALSTPYASDLENILLGFEEVGTDAEETEKERIEAISFLKERLHGKVLVNLGAGVYGSMQSLARESGTTTCIEIDNFFPEDATDSSPSVDLSPNKKNGEMQIVTVKSDMLDFLSRLPDESACITINGIDEEIIKNKDYHRALIEEIKRVLPKGGIVFGRNSSCLYLVSESLERINLEFLSGKYIISAKIYEKK